MFSPGHKNSQNLNTTLLCLSVSHHQLLADDQQCQVHSVQDVSKSSQSIKMKPAFAAEQEGCSYRQGFQRGKPQSVC